ncbi:MAG: CBS domain-containing protein [Alphaproteobacteria bacterium]|nr:CBS domain-containing protein [Alphaproteobacteria bacterium]MDD9919588.1 CBS domain-containing protein [Alphaproteobacteria bacterium]
MMDDSSTNDSGRKESFLSHWRRKAYALFSNDTEQEWQNLRKLNQVEEDEPLTEHERSLISAALQLDTLVADDVALPRSDIVFIKSDCSFPEVLKIFQTSRKARLLVIGEDLDDVQGFLSLKDVISYVGKEADFKLKDLIRPATFLPETLSVDRVLQRMKKQRAAIAVVTDEYGGTAGLLTLKDVLGELVGDLEDEDAEEAPCMMPLPLGNGSYKLDPKMPMQDFRTFFSLPEPMDEEDFETVSGYIFSLAGRVPTQGESVLAPDNLKFSVSKSDGRRLLEITVQKV